MRDAFASPDRKVWFVGPMGNFVAYMDPTSGGFRKFSIDDGTPAHNLVIDSHGLIWFTGNANGDA